MCERSGRSPDDVFDYLRRVRPRLDPRHRRGGPARRRPPRISPNKLPAARWVEIIEASHRAGLRSTSTVMFGHIEEPRELARHMRVVRELQERTGGITEFVPLSFIPFHTLLGRTHGIEEISRGREPQAHRRLPPGAGRTITNLQASWVKMGLDAATESLRWGVNDLGGTLMEENISRMAGSQHGVRLEPEQLIDAARARRAHARPAHDALRDRRDVLRPRAGDGPRAAGRAAGERRRCPSPSPVPGEVVVGVRACGVCRTDLHLIDGDLAEPKLPLVPGHQVVGEVVRPGEGAERFAPGDRSGSRGWAGPAASAATAARGGRTSASARASPAITLDGGYAELAVADERFCLPLPGGLRRPARLRRSSAPG